MNKLFYGDNLDWLPRIDPDSVDLVYLDPPFNSKVAYNLLYRSPDGEAAEAQYQTFVDSWRWGEATDRAFAAVIASGSPATDILTSLNNYMQKSDLMAYLVMMTARLVELHRILKSTGSLYLHCDPAASHYLKIILDSIFGTGTFRNEIIWRRTGSHNSAKRYGPIHDTILFYTKSQKGFTWNRVKRPYMQGHVEKAFLNDEGRYRTNYSGNVLSGSGRRNGESGKPWRGFDPDAKGRHWAIPGAILEDLDEDISELGQHEKLEYLYKRGFITINETDEWPRYQRTIGPDDGQPLSDIWAYQPYTEGTVFGSSLGIDDEVRWMGTKDGERLNYQTQKPLGLMNRIISASSKKGDLILDPFCGCGTTIESAQRSGRRWIGIDVTVLAIDVVERRLGRIQCQRGRDYEVNGIPLDMDAAHRLFADDAHQFQLWALTLVDGQPRDGAKKGADKGVDGIIYYQEDRTTVGKAIISVKGGTNIHAEHVRDLVGTMNNQRSKMGIMVTLHSPTKAMERAAREAESIEVGGKLRPRVQICTVEQLLKGQKPKLPPIYDIISAASAARRGKARIAEPTPEEIRKQPSFKLPISGGRKETQAELPLPDEPILVAQPAKAGRSQKRRRAR